MQIIRDHLHAWDAYPGLLRPARGPADARQTPLARRRRRTAPSSASTWNTRWPTATFSSRPTPPSTVSRNNPNRCWKSPCRHPRSRRRKSGWKIGNLHFPIAVGAQTILAPDDPGDPADARTRGHRLPSDQRDLPAAGRRAFAWTRRPLNRDRPAFPWLPLLLQTATPFSRREPTRIRSGSRSACGSAWCATRNPARLPPSTCRRRARRLRAALPALRPRRRAIRRPVRADRTGRGSRRGQTRPRNPRRQRATRHPAPERAARHPARRPPLASLCGSRSARGKWPGITSIICGVQAAVAGVPLEAALGAYFYQSGRGDRRRVAQAHPHRPGRRATGLARRLPRGCRRRSRVHCKCTRDEAGWFDPLLEIASMRHERADERLFIS